MVNVGIVLSLKAKASLLALVVADLRLALVAFSKRMDILSRSRTNAKPLWGQLGYQLNHSSVKVGVSRFHIATWFGNCSYRKLKVTIEKRKEVCPICQHDLVALRYFGNRCFVYTRDSIEYQHYEFCDMNEGQGDVWGEKHGHDFG